MIALLVAASLASLPSNITPDQRADLNCVEFAVTLNRIFERAEPTADRPAGDPMFHDLLKYRDQGAFQSMTAYFLGRLSVRDPSVAWLAAVTPPPGVSYRSAVWVEDHAKGCLELIPPGAIAPVTPVSDGEQTR